MPDEVEYIDEYLERHFKKLCGCEHRKITVRDFVLKNPRGTFLITMSGHITCCIDGVVYDTFDPGDRFIWDVYEVE